MSITGPTVNICHKLEPSDFCINTSSFKVLVGERRRPRKEEREHQDKVIQVKKKTNKKKSKKTQTHQPLPYLSMEKEGTTYNQVIFTTCFLQSSGITRIMGNIVFSFF